MVEQKAERRGELPGEGEASLDPSAFLPQELSDRRHGEAVVVGQRGSHARLVHGADRARGSVRSQEPRLHGNAGSQLDHDGDFLASLGDPDDEALEAIDHLVDAVAGGSDADRERREEHPLVAALPSEAAQRGPDPVDGDVLDEAHRVSSRGRSWKRGYR